VAAGRAAEDVGARILLDPDPDPDPDPERVREAVIRLKRTQGASRHLGG